MPVNCCDYGLARSRLGERPGRLGFDFRHTVAIALLIQEACIDSDAS